MSARGYALSGISGLTLAFMVLGLFALTKDDKPPTSEMVLWLTGVTIFTVSCWLFILTSQYIQQVSAIMIPVGLALYIGGIFLVYKD